MVVLVFAAFVNAFGMAPPVYELELWLAAQLNVSSEPLVLGLLFVLGLVALPFALLALAAWCSRALAGDKETLAAAATRYSYALVPIGFGMWLAHYGFHFLIGALTVIPVTQSFLTDFGIAVLGEPRWELAAIVPDTWLVPLELLLLELGMLVSLTVGYRIAREHQRSASGAVRALAPWARAHRGPLRRWRVVDDAADGNARHDVGVGRPWSHAAAQCTYGGQGARFSERLGLESLANRDAGRRTAARQSSAPIRGAPAAAGARRVGRVGRGSRGRAAGGLRNRLRGLVLRQRTQ